MKRTFSESIRVMMLFLCILAFASACGSVGSSNDGSQPGPEPASWTQQLGTTDSEFGNGIAVDSSGDVYVTGYTHGGLDGNINAGGTDIFLVKYDPSGTKQWTRQPDTATSDYGYGVAVDSSGNVYVTGYTNGGLDGNPHAGNYDIFLVKYDPSGIKQWTRQLGTINYDYGYGVAVDSSGNVYVSGETFGGLDGNINAGGTDIFLVKYDPSGTKQWTRQLGTTVSESGYGVAVGSSGNIYVTGYTNGGLDGNIDGGDSDIFLVKYDPSGEKQWTRQLGTGYSERGYEVSVDSSGNIYVTGRTNGGLDGNINAGDDDIFLVKYDPSGEKQWTRQLGTTDWDYGNGVSVDSSGNIYVTGRTDGGLDGNINAGGSDIFLVKYDPLGEKQWTRQLGTGSRDYGNGVSVDSSGNIYVTGRTDGGLDGNINAGDTDVFLVKYDPSGVKQ